MKKNSRHNVTGEELHIVDEFTVGNARIMLADNYYRDKMPEDVEQILREIARTASAHFRAAADKG